MSKSIIIYGTNYGTTEKYARELAKRTGINVVSYEKADIPKECEAIIYFGGLYAGGVKGLKETLPAIYKTSYKKFIIVTVGLADVEDDENINNIRKSLQKQLSPEVYESAEIYHLRGGIDYSRLNFPHKTMMKLLYTKAKNLPEEKKNAEVRAMIETYGKQVDFVDFKKLDLIEQTLADTHMIYELEDPDKVSKLFDGWQETLIWSCLQKVMGHIYVKDTGQIDSAVAVLGDFCFLAGKPDKELIMSKSEWCKQDFIIMVPQNEEWGKLIESCLGEKAKKVTRYAIKKELDVFDKSALQEAVNTLPEGFALQMMDEELFWKCKEIAWCKDWVSQYPDYKAYSEYGLGVVILKDGVPVSGASSYSGYLGGIEIEIDTKEEYRRKGLAYVSGAKLILECLEKGWYPSWDAQNKWSVALAEKLGYHFDHEYTAYEILLGL
ncbi:MAG: GNAT family N-acetyltransferase [Lachnospiraceae bacterium]|nr:GNAT family N-acetyltransferase [Lachnospiraceae bacterium]